MCIPVRGPSLAMLVEFQHDLGGVQGRAGVGIQQQLFVLGQILGWGLLSHPSTVKQLPLQEGQVSLSDRKRNKMWVKKESIYFHKDELKSPGSVVLVWCHRTQAQFYGVLEGINYPQMKSIAPSVKVVIIAFHCRFGKLSSALRFAL